MNRVVLFLVLPLVLLLGSCDVTKLMGSDDDDSDGVSAADASAAITSFVFHAEDNPVLDDNHSTLIADSGVITAFLPGTVVASGAPLEARVGLSEGAKISPNPQIARSYNAPVTFTVTSFGGEEVNEFQVRPQTREAAAGARVIDFTIDSSAPENSALRSSVPAEVSGTNIFVQLPYQLMQQDELLLKPDLAVSDGATVSPSGPQDFKTPLSYTVTGPDGSVTIYAVETAVDPNTLTFLDLSEPFYVDGSNVRTAFSDSGIIAESDAQTVSVAPLVWDVVDGKQVGFFDYSAPYNGTVNFEPVVLGSVPPYTVSVTSANGEWTQDYTIDLDRITPSATGIKSAEIRFADAYSRYRSVSGQVAYWREWEGGYQGWQSAPRTTYTYTAISTWSYTVPAAANSYIMSSGPLSDYTGAYYVKNVSTPYVFWSHSSHSSPSRGNDNNTYTSGWIDPEYYSSGSLREAFQARNVTSTEYTARSNVKLDYYRVVLDDYAWVEGVFEGPVSTGYSTSQSGVNQVVTFSLNASTSYPVVGEVATFDVVAESGDRQTYTININN